MDGAKEVVDRLYGVECGGGDFDEDGVPVAHRAVPETGQLEGFEGVAVERFRRYEAGVVVDMLRQVEFTSFGIVKRADEVNRIEMSGMLHHVDILRIAHINLGALEYLR